MQIQLLVAAFAALASAAPVQSYNTGSEAATYGTPVKTDGKEYGAATGDSTKYNGDAGKKTPEVKTNDDDSSSKQTGSGEKSNSSDKPSAKKTDSTDSNKKTSSTDTVKKPSTEVTKQDTSNNSSPNRGLLSLGLGLDLNLDLGVSPSLTTPGSLLNLAADISVDVVRSSSGITKHAKNIR